MIQEISLTSYGFLNKNYMGSYQNDCFHIFYVFDGSGVLIIDSSSYQCFSDMIFFSYNTMIAISKSDNSSPINILHLMFTCRSNEIKDELKQLPVLLPYTPFQRDTFINIIHECNIKKPFYNDMCSLYIENILIPTVVNSKRSMPVKSLMHPLAKKFPNPLDITCEYIKHNYNDDLYLNTLCNISHTSPTQLNNMFRNMFFMSPIEYINSFRISKAKELLFFTNMSVTQIAEAVGFKTIHYFSRIFKEKEGISPRIYKKAVQKNFSDYGVNNEFME